MQFLKRRYAVCHVNATRLPARVDRPDQMIYQIMAQKGALADAPYVLLANTGAQGRFNRAQRAAQHFDETIALITTGALLGFFAVGPLMLPLVVPWAGARVTFTNVYKQSNNDRLGPVRLCIRMEGLIAGMVFICAIQGIVMAFHTHFSASSAGWY